MAHRKRIYSNYDKMHQATDEEKKKRNQRNVARARVFRDLREKYWPSKAKKMMEWKDVDHKKPLSKWWSNELSNLRLISRKLNRSRK